MKNKDRTVVVGGGLAGIAAALSLQSMGAKVIVFDMTNEQALKPGDALSAQVLPILSLLKLLNIPELKKAPRITHIKSIHHGFENTLAWEGFLINRKNFENQLVDIAISRGIPWYRKTKVEKVEYKDDGWLITVRKHCKNDFAILKADNLIDASGRNGMVVRLMGKRYVHLYPQAAVCGTFRKNRNCEKVPNIKIIHQELGWWYIAEHCDIKSIQFFNPKPLRTAISWIEMTRKMNLIDDASLVDNINIFPAQSSLSECSNGSSWIAVGDAAACFDPLSGYGMTFALGTGYYGACALIEKMAGNLDALNHYSLFVKEKSKIVQLQTIELKPL